METLQPEQGNLGKPKDRTVGIGELPFATFGSLCAMCGADSVYLPSRDEIESLITNLDLFTRTEFEHMLLFIDRFLKRTACAIADNIRYYLNHLSCEDTIEHFLDTMGGEIALVRGCYHGANPFESLLALYLLTIEKGERI